MKTTKYHHIVVTAGISLFSPNNVFRKWTDELDIFVFERTNPKPKEGLTDETAMTKWETGCREANLSKIAAVSPKSVSAEYSLLYSLKSSNCLGDNPRVVLVHTDTIGGKAAASLLKRLLPEDFKGKTICREVADIDTTNRERLRRSLGGFMETVAASLENADPSYTCFAPVGGYKVMTSLGYLAGAYMGFPTAYLHEDNQALHEIPAVPIRLAEKELQKIAPLLTKIQRRNQEWENLSVSEQELVLNYAYLFEIIESLVGCNAFAEFLMARPEYKNFFKPKVLLSPEVDKLIRDGAFEIFIRQQIEELIKKLASPGAYRSELHHEATFDTLQNTQYSLYKGASGGRNVFRAAYYYDEEGQELHLRRLWTEHDIYERQARQGIGLYEAPDGIEWIEMD